MDRADEQKQMVMDFQTTFAGVQGERVLKELSRMCYEDRATYVDANAMGTAYHEGMRSVILGIRNMLAKNPNEVKQEKAKDK